MSTVLRIRGTAEYKAAKYHGWWQHAKQRLDDERVAHREELARLKRVHQQELGALEHSLSAGFERRLADELARLKSDHEGQLEAYRARLVELESELRLYRDRVAGKNHGESLDFSGDGVVRKGKKRRRKGGKVRGTGGGRRCHQELPVVDEEVTVAAAARQCPQCGLGYAPLTSSEDSELVSWEYRLVRKRIRRRKYVRSCRCPGVAPILTAPLPLRALPGSKYDDAFWIQILVSKYGYQIPTAVTCALLAEHGLVGVRPSTLSAGIDRASPLFAPLVEAIVKHNQEAELNQTDESSLAVFVEGGTNHYFYQYSSVDTVVYRHTVSRSGEEIAAYLSGSKTKLVCDRHSLYKSAAVTAVDEVELCFCWAHVRRDFIKIGRYQRGHRTWAVGHLRVIRRLFQINERRCVALLAGDADGFACHDEKLRRELTEWGQRGEAELADERLSATRRQPLASLLRHWEGLIVFVDHPEVPMDNNRAERQWRPLAKFRRNCYGVFSEKFAVITALLMTVLMTLKVNGIALIPYLEAYFEACAQAGGQAPKTLVGLLPWALSPELEKRVRGHRMDSS